MPLPPLADLGPEYEILQRVDEELVVELLLALVIVGWAYCVLSNAYATACDATPEGLRGTDLALLGYF